MAELADARDSKSRSFFGVSVRSRPPVLFYILLGTFRVRMLLNQRFHSFFIHLDTYKALFFGHIVVTKLLI